MQSFGAAALHGLTSRRLEGGLDRLFGIFTALCQVYEESRQVPGGRALRVAVTPETELNARAYRTPENRSYVIEFTLGLIVWLDHVAGMIAAHTASDFKLTGHWSFAPGESPKDPHAALQERIDGISRVLPENYLGAWEGFFQKFAFAIFAHELSHILRGHLDYLAREANLTPEADELSLRRVSSRKTAALIRLLEYDADTYAADILTRLTLSPPRFMPRWRVGTAREALIETLLGSILFFVALEQEDVDEPAPDQTYPAPTLRLLTMLIEMDRIWSQDNEPAEDFFEDIFTGTLSILILFEPIYPELDRLRDLLDEAVQAKVIAEASEIIDELRDFEHGR